MSRNVCPECVQGKHDNCDGTAWHDERDEVVSCDCALGEHEEPAEMSIPSASSSTSSDLPDEDHAALVAEIRDGGTGLLALLDEAKSAMLDAVPSGTFVDPRPLQEIVLRAWLEAKYYVRTPPPAASSD